MIPFAQRSLADRTAFFAEVATRRDIARLIVEKDFWACFALRMLFQDGELGQHLVFKGGTSLSKVFGIINRFSEDLDLSVAPEWLVSAEADPDGATSRTDRGKRYAALQTACAIAVRDRIAPLLERQIAAVLGEPSGRQRYITFVADSTTDSAVLLFQYPTKEKPEAAYIEPRIKLEFGSLTGQRPVGEHPVTPWIAEEFPQLFQEASTRVIALEAERTFWEKATILHAEHHRPAEKPMRARHSRDCYDLCALWEHETGKRAVLDHALREEVVSFKEHYFRSAWTHFEQAKPGSFRVVPPEHRLAGLRADYRAMRPMFLDDPQPFDELLATLKRIEDAINAGE